MDITEAKQMYADETNDWLNLFEEDENLEKYREKIKDYDNKEIYGDKGKDLLQTIFEEDDINELYAIHSKYEKPMKIGQKISEKRTQLDNLNDEISKNTNTIKTLE